MVAASFATAFLLGTASIAYAWHQEVGPGWTVFWPSAITLAYIIYSWRVATALDLRDQVGDSQYYLGFLLTMVAIAVSMVDLAVRGGEPNQTALIARIGLALVTSIMGLSSRLMLTQFHLTTDEESGPARENFSRQTGEFRKAMEDSVRTFRDANKKIIRSLRDSGDAHAKRTNELTEKNAVALEKLVSGFHTRIDTTLSQIASRVGEFELFPVDAQGRLETAIGEIEAELTRLQEALGTISDVTGTHACQWRSKKGPPRRCKKGPLGGCGLVPVVHGRAPRATRRALNRLTRRRAREGPVGPRGQAWAGWSVQLAVGV